MESWHQGPHESLERSDATNVAPGIATFVASDPSVRTDALVLGSDARSY